MNITDANITEEKLYLFNQGQYFHSYRIFGAHPVEGGVRFTVWCPEVKSVGVIGSFNDWTPQYLTPRGSTGVYSGIIPEAKPGDLYKYRITTAAGETFDKADPYAFWAEVRPGTASRIARLDGYTWHDGRYRAIRRSTKSPRPMNIYEVHLGSWKQQEHPEDPDYPFLSYRQLADELIPYAKDMGYTHLELLPVMEHPFDGSWGYQVTGFFAPTSRYGGPQDFMYFVDQAHQHGLGVILDWVPGHFCRDAHGLGRFNGKMLFEGADHPEWGTYKFDFTRSEVRSFLISSALYWLGCYHADGIRVDGVTSMLYLNFGLPDWAEKTYNDQGGEENTAAVEFLRQLNDAVHTFAPGAITVAEESSAWPHVTGDTASGGLGFDYKWDMGWMNDTLEYCKTDFPFRSYHHNKLTFSMAYGFSERFILPLSHVVVLHGKLSLMGRMPGDYWRKFAGLRLLALYQITHPGGKLSFMSTEYGPFIEWREYESLEWFLLDYPTHQMHQDYVKQLNRLYQNTPALWQDDHSWEGFHWLDADDSAQSILLFRRTGREKTKAVTVLLNFQPEVYSDFRIGVPYPGQYQELLSSDATEFGGSGKGNPDILKAEPVPCHGEKWSVRVTVPPIGGILLQKLPRKNAKQK
ncbi:MAG: 1,4-alpha-glucan branching protein GlgB [Oscillospiraceae bacterium]|nr:1,4-alpha-glucan branching protein GlgB [Oscillospiraceae bacterium]